MDSNLGLSDKNLKKERKLAQEKNALGFTTKLSGSYSSSSSIIKGSKILYNGGNAYNGTVFTCPSSGLYLFHVSLLSSTKNNGCWIYKNSQQLTLAYTGGNPQYNGASVSAAVWLDVGDQVYLRPYSSSLYVDHNSAFTGVKVN
uniref:Adiponectin-like n=1 Tax=Crassostrea virginica TaxID=6565 RepID=A0A8B8BIW0_CRAVI|nr:adiponectin-like [Crassostrea virginica]